MIQWEEFTLEEATHLEINGEVHELCIRPYDGYKSKYQVIIYDRSHIKVYMENANWQLIQAYAFPILGIKCLRKKKQELIEFGAMFVSYDGNWRPLYSKDDGIAYQNFKKTKFKCVEILEDEK